jgi:tetratricopeptide (TPR) repeat protein
MNPRRSKSLVHLRSWRLHLVCCVPLTFLSLSIPQLDAVEKDAPRREAHGADFIRPAFEDLPQDLQLTREASRKADALASFTLGFAAENEADNETALREYRRVLDLDPGYTELAIKVAYEYARLGDVSEGINVLKDSIKAAPRDATAHLYLSQLYAKYLKKPDVALRYASRAMELDPKNFAAYLALFEIYSETGQKDKAEKVLSKASDLKNDDPYFWLKLGEIYCEQLLKEDGSSAPRDLARLNAIFAKAVKLADGDVDVLVGVADYYVVSNQIPEAIPLYLSVLKNSSDPNNPELGEIRDKLARSLLANGQREKAIDVLEQMLKINPLRAETYEFLGQIYEQQGAMEKALEAYQQTLLLAPSQPLNYLRIADMQLNVRRPEKAVETLREARKRFPDIPQVTYSLAFALSQSGDHAGAMTTFEEALKEAEVLQSEMLNGNFFFNYGAAAEQAGLNEKAAELLQKSIELDPQNAARAYNYLGYMWVDRGENLDEAGNLITRALNLEPDNGAYMDSLGWFFYKKGEYQKALKELLRATRHLEEEDSVVYDHIGDTYAKLKDTAQALAYWEKAVALDKGNQKILGKIENAKAIMMAKPAGSQSTIAPDASPVALPKARQVLD